MHRAAVDAARKGSQRMDKEHVEMLATSEAERKNNVFAALDFDDAQERRAKALVMRAIAEVIQSRGLTQRQASDMMRVTQQHVTKIERGTLEKFGLDRLIRCARALGVSVSIQLEPGQSSDPVIGDLTVSR
jgi:predicted XRE-type DNA-binding protein